VKNPSVLASGLAVARNAESTALYCTGLSNETGKPGVVTFYNAANSPRRLSVEVVSNEDRTHSSFLELAAHSAQSIEPSTQVVGASYAVAVQIDGGGVVGEEVAGARYAQVPCSSVGLRHWYASGFSTLVGSSAYVSIYNPTATSAVFSASIYTTTGLVTPASFQGLSILAHHQYEIDLGSQVVNTSNIGVGVVVNRGSLVFTGVQDAGGTVSLDSGVGTASSKAWFPSVTTASATRSQLRLVNPTSNLAKLSVHVQLGSYKIAPQTLTLDPFSSGAINIDPNVAIPDAGFASLTLRASGPVIAALANGVSPQISLSSPVTPQSTLLIHDFSGLGFSTSTITNTSRRALRVSFAQLESRNERAVTVTSRVTIPGRTNERLSAIIPAIVSSKGAAFIASASTNSLIVTETLPGRPEGLYVVSP
jgi:hypothetical protein